MNERVNRLRQQSYDATVALSTERAELLTDFYRENMGKHSTPVMRALAFEHLCRHKTVSNLSGADLPQRRGPANSRQPSHHTLRGR